MKKLLILLVATLVAFAFFGCQPEEVAEEEAPAEPVEFILVNGTEPETLDPHLISGVPEHRIYMEIFEGLMTYDPETAEPVPGLAESWEVSEDGTVYTFHLRETTWSDGVPITAQTVVDSWLRMLDPETAAPYAWFPNMFIKGAQEYNSGEAGPEVVGVEAVDDYTFRLELVGPLPYVLGALPHYSFAVVPMHAIEKYGKEWTSPANFVGNGPFTLETWQPQQQITVVPNETYWDAETVSLDRITFLPIDDNNTGYNMFLNDEADWMTTVPLDQMDQAKMRDDYHNAPYLGTYYYTIQTEKDPFDDARVRKALAMAFDRETLVENITKGGQIPAYSMVPDMAGYPGIEGNKMDVERAQELLAEAGYPGGEGFPTFEILYNTSESHKKIAEYIQEQWRDNLGIDCELINQEWSTYLASRRAGDFQIARAGWIGDYQDPNTFLDMFVTGGAMNGGRYSNAEYDRLINEAARMPAGEKRFEALQKAEEIFITQDQGVIPVYFYTTNNMIDLSEWGGWYVNTMDYHPLKYVYKK
ncbi:MAG TPA: peptide ABC transporter substrate-binding protein [Sediminispirochaeta sp.]|nr:peptide ABC transporter substrate-binding protein [Sediminispirochaeta sp.]